jgi:choline-sulfatase
MHISKKQSSAKKLPRRKFLKYGVYGAMTTSLSPVIWLNGCSGKPEPREKTNVILISIDTLRKDHCSIHGYPKDTTPVLRKLASKGILFDSAYSPTAETGPSHATMFTSLYPITHRVIKNGINLTSSNHTIAEYLDKFGYQTAAVVGSFVLDSKFGFAQGFSFYEDNFTMERSSQKLTEWATRKVENGFDQPASDTSKKAIEWLQKNQASQRPFFLFVHYYDPHDPYVAPQPFASRYAPQKKNPLQLDTRIGQYDAEIAYTDYEIGNIVKTLEWMGHIDDTMIVITSDHGEGLGQHGHLGHTINLYEELVRVPLLFYWPKHIPRDRIINAPVELVDLMPTIFDLIGITDDEFPFQGQNLSPAILNNITLNKNRPIFLHRRHYNNKVVSKTWLNGEKFGIRVGKYKYIVGKDENTTELFDLSLDPNELSNLHDLFPERSAELETRLQKWKKENTRKSTEQNTISDEDRKRLETLGYVD